MMHDIRLAIRTLGGSWGMAAAAIVTLALGIGATTAIFTMVYGVLLRPLPYRDPDRLVQLSEIVPGGTSSLPPLGWISNVTLHAWASARRTIGPITHFGANFAILGLDSPLRVVRSSCGPGFFDVLGLDPVAGRFFREEDVVAGAPPVVVLSAETWRDSFGADPSIVGRSIAIDERPHRIIGVAPAGVRFPTPDTRVWTPARLDPLIDSEGRPERVVPTRALARLQPGATPEQAAAEGTALARAATRPIAFDMLFGKGGPVDVQVRTLADQMTLRVRAALLVLQSGVGVLLLIACANVANLFLSRGISRERELAIRAALGASRQRMLREALSETLVVATLGGVLAIGVAWALVRLLPSLTAENFPRLHSVQLDWPALIVAIVVTVFAGLLAGLAPALRATRRALLPALREGVGASAGHRTGVLRRALLVAEASLAILLLVGATLLGRSFVNLTGTNAGYDPTNVLTARIYLPGAPRGQAQTDVFIPELLARVRALPGITSAGAANMAPMGRSTFVSGFEVPGPDGQQVFARAVWYVTTPGYAETLRLSLRAGRLLDDRDVSSGIQSMLVNESFVRTFLSGVNPIGLRFPAVQVNDKRPAEIVGVVENVLKDSLDQQPQPEVYVLPAGGVTIRREIYLVLRSAGPPAAHAADVRRIVGQIRADAAIDGVEPLALQLSNSVAQPRFAMMVSSSMAGAALLLAAIGLYGVLSYTVARRQREIGVRSALGATRGGLVMMVVREGMAVAVVGLTLGVGIAAASTRLMQSLLIGVEPLDVMSFSVASVALLVVALLACAVPAWRAAATDPIVALRGE